jgi:hypothetical protein
MLGIFSFKKVQVHPSTSKLRRFISI